MSVTFALSRLGFFAVLFLVARIPPRGDIPSFYWNQAVGVLQGLAPYRDFASSYAPLHPYLDAAFVRLWFSPLAIILAAVLTECLLVPLWLHLGRRIFPEREVRTAALLYVTSAISLQFVTVDGQDNVMIALAFALAILWLDQRPAFSGAAVGLAAATTKFLPLVFAPVFLVSVRRRWRWNAGLVLVVALIYGAFAANHLPVLSVVANEGALRSAGNLPYVIESLAGIVLPARLYDGVMAAVFLVIFALVTRAATGNPSTTLRMKAVTFGTAAITLALVLFSKKSWPPYLMLALFPICLVASTKGRRSAAGFGLFGFIAVLEHSYWATLLRQLTAEELHRGLRAGQMSCYVFLAIEAFLVAGYAWLLIACLRQLGSIERKRVMRLHAEVAETV